MGIFSFLFKSKEDEVKIEKAPSMADYLSKDTLWEIFKFSNFISLVFTQEDGWIAANKRFFDVFGFEDMQSFTDKHESIREIFKNESEEIFTEDDKSWLDYIKRYKQDGYALSILDTHENTIYIKARCYNLVHKPDIYVLEFEDVTKLHTAERKTKEIEKLKTKFLSNIGHEFRTPMNGILGFAELLEQTDLTQQQKEYVRMISKSSKNLMLNIENLLDLSQLQGKRLQLNNAPFSPLFYMEDVVKSFVSSAKDKNIKLLAFIDPKLPLEVISDAKKITQIMNALIQNGIKFTQSGGRIIVETKLLKRKQNGECSIVFGVRDNGRGISKEQLEIITEPFHSGNHADERLGVGLSLSNGLVELLGSKLHIHSEEGEGSYFNFVLDFKESKGQTYKMMPKKKVKVLLLDRYKINEANFLATYLRSFAIDVVKANVLDEHVYDGIETLYIVADQNDSSWMLKLGTFKKRAPIVVLLGQGEKLQTKLTHIVDSTITQPLLPSVIAKHLHKLYDIKAYVKTSHDDNIKLKDNISALVVEDNLINQRLVQILLREYNIAVSIASNGNEAVDKSFRNKFDIIFMDIDMPEKDGIEATKDIKQRVNPNFKTPIIALTAMAMEGDREMLLSKGLDDYLSKPLTKDKLEYVLNKYLKVNNYEISI